MHDREFLNMYDCEYRMHLKLRIRINKLIKHYSGNLHKIQDLISDLELLMSMSYNESLEVSKDFDPKKIDSFSYPDEEPGA